MAAPAYRSSTHLAGNSRTTLTVVKPTGTVDDDILLVNITVQANNPTITAPSGWTIVDTAVNGTGHKSVTYWKRAASEGASWDWTIASNWCEAMCLCYSGGSTGAGVIDAHDVATNSSNSTTTPAVGGSTNTTVADTTIVWIGIDNYGSTWSAVPTSHTQRESYSGAIIAASDLAQASAGTIGSLTGTSGTSDAKSAFAIALAPTGGGGGNALPIGAMLRLGVGK